MFHSATLGPGVGVHPFTTKDAKSAKKSENETLDALSTFVLFVSFVVALSWLLSFGYAVRNASIRECFSLRVGCMAMVVRRDRRDQFTAPRLRG